MHGLHIGIPTVRPSRADSSSASITRMLARESCSASTSGGNWGARFSCTHRQKYFTSSAKGASGCCGTPSVSMRMTSVLPSRVKYKLGGPRGRQPRVRDQQFGIGSHDLRGIGWFRLHAAEDVGRDTFVKLETAAQCQVNAGLLVEMGMGDNALWLGADKKAGEVHAVAADVHEGAATSLAPVAWILPIPPAGGPVAADVQDPSRFHPWR